MIYCSLKLQQNGVAGFFNLSSLYFFISAGYKSAIKRRKSKQQEEQEDENAESSQSKIRKVAKTISRQVFHAEVKCYLQIENHSRNWG